MDSDDFGALVLVLLFLALLIGGLFALTNWSRDNTTKDCQQTYGQEWTGKYDHYGPNFCVNPQGEVKYLQ